MFFSENRPTLLSVFPPCLILHHLSQVSPFFDYVPRKKRSVLAFFIFPFYGAAPSATYQSLKNSLPQEVARASSLGASTCSLSPFPPGPSMKLRPNSPSVVISSPWGYRCPAFFSVHHLQTQAFRSCEVSCLFLLSLPSSLPPPSPLFVLPPPSHPLGQSLKPDAIVFRFSPGSSPARCTPPAPPSPPRCPFTQAAAMFFSNFFVPARFPSFLPFRPFFFRCNPTKGKVVFGRTRGFFLSIN